MFCGKAGEHLDGSALRRRFKKAVSRAGIRELRFHDLRHTFGSLAINRASIVQVQAWMGHADVDTTMRYLHHRCRGDEAELLAEAFEGRGAHRRTATLKDTGAWRGPPGPQPPTADAWEALPNG